MKTILRRKTNIIVTAPSAASACRTLLHDDRGVVAVEAGFVLPIYVYFAVFLLQLSMVFFYQEVLDNAVASAARTIQVGSAQGQASSNTLFVSNVLCPQLNGLILCSSLNVNVQSVGDFYSNANYTVPRNKDGSINTSALSYCNGTPNQLMMLRALYNAPFNLWPMSGTVGGQTVIISTAAFQNENYPNSQSGTC